MASELEVSKALNILIAAYPNAKIVEGAGDVPGTIEVYAVMLSDLSADALMAAIKYVIATHPNFLPSVSTIREAADKLTRKATVCGMDAWGHVLAAVRDVGYMHRPDFEDPAIARAVESIGWRNICMSDEQDFAIRAQFIKAYEAFTERIKEEDILLNIPEARKIMQLTGAVTKRLTAGR